MPRPARTDYASVRELATQHADLLKAIESGRPATAEAAIREHLENATAWLIEHVATASAPPAGAAPPR